MSYRGCEPKKQPFFLSSPIYLLLFRWRRRREVRLLHYTLSSLCTCLNSLSIHFLTFHSVPFSLIPHFSAPLALYKSRKRRRPLFAKKAQKLLLFTSVDDSLILRLYFFLPSFSVMLKKFPFWELSLSLLLCFALLSSTSLADSDSDSDRLDLDHSNSSESNVSLSKPKEGSFAHMIDQALANEFPENDQPEGSLRSNLSLSLQLTQIIFENFNFFFLNFLLAVADSGSFNNSVAEQQVSLAIFFFSFEFELVYYYKQLQLRY